jgi:hypothetical protein
MSTRFELERDIENAEQIVDRETELANAGCDSAKQLVMNALEDIEALKEELQKTS